MQVEVDDLLNFGSTYFGDDDVSNEPEKPPRDKPIYAGLTKKEMNRIRQDISETTRPVWNSGPPANLGERGHSKLKADQWRSALEFDIPVSLVWLYSQAARRPHAGRAAHLQKLAQSSMLLAIAIRLATSHHTSRQRADAYTQTMHAYLQTLLELSPAGRLLPNHHNALHIAKYLILFGPMHGWWMFPFERLIGILQQLNTNSKLGQ